MPRLPFILIFGLVLAGCAPRAAILLPMPDAPATQREEVFVATTRALDQTDIALGRSADLSFARYDVNVPPDRSPGSVPYAPRAADADATRHFFVTAQTDYATDSDFGRALSDTLSRKPAGERDVVLYVHGYNNTFADGLFRIAQMRRDLNLGGVAVHYAWPSAGHPLGYAYDRDSALFGRDGLEQVLRGLTKAGVRRVVLVAHSMGALVTMEALRTLHIAGDRRTLSRIEGVILLSPDLDVDVFHAQAARIDPLPEPFVIFTSQRDRALAVSARITGQTARLGNLNSVEGVADLRVTVIDLSNAPRGEGDQLNHFTAATSPTIIQLLRRVADVNSAFEENPSARAGLLPGTVLTLQNATQVILTPGSR